MPSITITSVTAINNSPGSQLTISGTWSDVSTITFEIRCKDESGFWQLLSVPENVNPPIALNTDGTYSVTVDSPCGCGGQFFVAGQGYDEGGSIICHADLMTTLDCEIHCCPSAAEVSITPDVADECTEDCQRLVSIAVDYDGEEKPGCPASAVMQVAIEDSSGAVVAIFPAVPFSLGGSYQHNWAPISLPSGNAYQAVLTVFVGDVQCAGIIAPFTVAACERPPPCPIHLTLAAADLGCSAAGDACLPTAQFVIGGGFGTGCGSIGATVLTLDYGDGASETVIVTNDGAQQFVLSHHYASGGFKTAHVTVVNPPGCSPDSASASVTLGNCSPADCIECPPPPKPPGWCLCKSCWLFSQKPGKGFCKPLMLLLILLVASGSLSILHNFLLSPDTVTWEDIVAVTGIWGLAFFPLIYAELCGKCCTACAIWPGVILGILISLLLWIFLNTPPLLPTPLITSWVERLIALLLGAFVLYFIYSADCSNEEEEQLSDENWCKPAE